MCVGEGSAGPGHEGNFWNYRNVLYLDWVVLTQMDMFVKNYRLGTYELYFYCM